MKRIEIWTKEGCHHCERAKTYLNENLYSYRLYVLEEGDFTIEDLKSMFPSAKGFPVITIDDIQMANVNAMIKELEKK
jgi:glutaredoxin